MTTIKVLGTGCVTCKRLLSDVKEMVTKNNWQAQVEYVTDLPTIMSRSTAYLLSVFITRKRILKK